jgi:hypothetical protein
LSRIHRGAVRISSRKSGTDVMMSSMVPGAIITVVPLVAMVAFIVWALGSLMASSSYSRRRSEDRP